MPMPKEGKLAKVWLNAVTDGRWFRGCGDKVTYRGPSSSVHHGILKVRLSDVKGFPDPKGYRAQR